jgi:small nuclear ribonucleoprotein (snRNP)-like protein
LAIRGTLHSVDQYLNIKLLNVEVVQPEKFPHMVRLAAYASPRASARTARALPAHRSRAALTPTAPPTTLRVPSSSNP